MEQQELNLVEVQITSKENVKPSVPPPSHPTTFSLSLNDQIFPMVHPMPMLLFYQAIGQTPRAAGCAGAVDVSGLKLSLSHTLDRFYPLAGRFQDESTISCNDQGVPFIETKVGYNLSHVLKARNKLKLLTKLLPPPEFIPLAIQLNIFLCGGVVIGCYTSHKFMDASSLGTFLNHWAALASKRFTDLIQPNYEATINAFPPVRTLDQVFTNNNSSITDMDPLLDTTTNETHNNKPHSHPKIVVKSFLFNIDAISKLKGKATSERVPKPSRFEALAGFIWEQSLAAAAAAAATRTQVEHTQLLINVDMRKRMSPPLPKGSMGNFFVPHVQAKARTISTLQDLVAVIHSTLANIFHKITTVYQGENGGQVILSERKAELLQAINNKEESQEGVYRLSSLCNAGFNEADFGFGKPIWVVPVDGRQTPLMFRNLIFLTDYNNPVAGEGVEAWLFLEESDMKALEANPHFLAFASPN